MAAAVRCVSALVLALPGAEGTFLFSDKLAGTKTNVLPLGDPALKLSRAFIVTRQTSGVLGGLLGAQHGQLILEPQSREHLWAVDLHTIRDPKRPEVRLDLAELCIVRVPWVDVPSSDFYNAKTVFSAAEQAAKREESPGWAPRGILETYEFEAAALPSERMMLSFTRAFHVVVRTHRVSGPRWPQRKLAPPPARARPVPDPRRRLRALTRGTCTRCCWRRRAPSIPSRSGPRSAS